MEWWLRKQVQQQWVCEWDLVKDYILGVSDIMNSNSTPKSSILNNQVDRSVTQIHLYKMQYENLWMCRCFWDNWFFSSVSSSQDVFLLELDTEGFPSKILNYIFQVYCSCIYHIDSQAFWCKVCATVLYPRDVSGLLLFCAYEDT